MKIPKFLLQQVSFTVFRVSFYTLATVVAFLMVFGSAGIIKQAFVANNAYQRFVPSVFASQEAAGQQTGSIPLGDPEIQKIIKQSFPPEVLQLNMELVIDRTYAWLNGQIPEPDFTVDFTPNVTYMADHLSNYAVTRLRNLPVCDKPPETIDPFTAECQPEFFDFEQSQADLMAAIKANNGILPNVVYTVNDLPKTADGKRLVDQYAYAPELFRAIRYAPGVLLCATLLSGLHIVYLARRKREAIRWLGTNASTSALFIVLSPLFYIFVFPRFFPSMHMGSSADVSTVIGDVITKVSAEFNTSLILVGLVLTLIGAAVVVLERASRPKSKYIKVSNKSGLLSSERQAAPSKSKRGKRPYKLADAPIQTSEGPRNTGKYQKDKAYRTIHAKEYS